MPFVDTPENPPRDELSPPSVRVPTTTSRVQVQNRRYEYLHRNPAYFDNLDHELADPILYERAIKRFQTPAERESQRRAKGYGRTLEHDLVRSETRLSQIDNPQPPHSPVNGSEPRAAWRSDPTWDRPVASKEDGVKLWRSFLEAMFVHGQDGDFNYSLVDENDDYDTLARRDAEDAWFEAEEPSWSLDVEGGTRTSRELDGETGVQDF